MPALRPRTWAFQGYMFSTAKARPVEASRAAMPSTKPWA